MPVPSTSYLRLVGGATSTISNIFTSTLIKAGDLIKVTGTASNNGIFLVAQVVNNLNSGEAAGVGTSSASSFTDNTRSAAISSGTTIIMDGANANLTAGLSVSGTNIKGGSTIASVTQTSNPATFELSDGILGSISGGTTLTFGDRDIYYVLKGKSVANESSAGSTDPTIQVIRSTGDKMLALGQKGISTTNPAGVDVWSNNATTDYTSQNSGWTQSAISPTLDGLNGAKYIYTFVDEVLRVCDTETTNTSIIKWFGYIQRNQFNHGKGLAFTGWQEHSSVLRSPETNSEGLTIAFGHTTRSGLNTPGAYYNEASNKSRGVARKLRNASDTALLLDGAVSSTTSTSFVFDDGSNDVLDQNFAGELITINTDYDIRPTEILFCTRPAAGLAANVQYSRDYGGLGSDTYSNNETPILRRGVGFNIGVTNGSADGDWEGLTYEFYQSFLYDETQESIPVRMGDGAATIAAFNHDQTEGKSMCISVYADVAYSGRISGGRIYIREANTDAELILLVDIDIVKGIRTTIDGDHVAWSPNHDDVDKGFAVIADSTGNSVGPNIDTYTTINGFAPDARYVSLGGAAESYQASVVENRRNFIANVRVLAPSGELDTFGDRIMYSEINKFDTILPHNFIDVSKGDYGVYTALFSYADRLLAFKHNLVHIINIASPSPASWFLEETVKYSGVNKPFSIAKTKYGVAWLAEDGCFIYDGRRVTNLIKDKIAVNKSSYIETSRTWNDWYRGTANVKDPMLGYDSVSNSLIMVRSPNDSTDNSNQGWIYDFDSDGWVYHDSIFTNNHFYTNFSTDFNNNLIVATSASASDTVTDVKKYLPITLNSIASQTFVTKDIDFGQPGLIKKIYKVIVTFKSDGAETTPFKYAIDGKQDFSGSGGGTFTGNFTDTSNQWDVVTLTPSSTISCQSIQIKDRFEFQAFYSQVYCLTT